MNVSGLCWLLNQSASASGIRPIFTDVYRRHADQLPAIIAAINNQKADLQVDSNCSGIGEPSTNDSVAAFAHFWSTEDTQFKRGERE
jgi:hypothetical protein